MAGCVLVHSVSPPAPSRADPSPELCPICAGSSYVWYYLYSCVWKHSQAEFSDRVRLTSRLGRQPAPPAASAQDGSMPPSEQWPVSPQPASPSAEVLWEAGGCTWTLPFYHVVSHQHERGWAVAPQATTSEGIMSCSGVAESFLIRRRMGLSQWQMGPKAPSPLHCPSDLDSHPQVCLSLDTDLGWQDGQRRSRRPCNQ